MYSKILNLSHNTAHRSVQLEPSVNPGQTVSRFPRKARRRWAAPKTNAFAQFPDLLNLLLPFICHIYLKGREVLNLTAP